MKLWESPETTAVNRAPVMPFLPAQQHAFDGEWRFQLLDSPRGDIGDTWSSTSVPSLWTMQGTTDRPQYTNVQMPFDELPPLVPAKNPTGVYERDVMLPAAWEGRRSVLRVGGFENFLQVYINDEFVGMAKDGRLAADFDVTEHLRAGENRIRLMVSKWSDATFIEDQDQWWHGGLSRSVLLYSTPHTHVDRLHLTPDLSDGSGVLRLRATIAGLHARSTAHALRLRIPELQFDATVGTTARTEQVYTEDEQRIAYAWFTSEFADAGAPPELLSLQARMEPKITGTAEAVFALPDAEPWSAERPRLYGVIIDHLGSDGAVLETFELQVGFRSTQVVGRELLVNGQPVTIYGVNRHDFHPSTGRVLSRDDIRADLVELKRWNVNAIRTSHYPNDPALLDLADELGFYVIDEANIEAHAYMHSLCDDPRYLGAFVDRVSRMVQRDLHHASVILWSLGNESGYGANHDAAAAWVRRFDPTRPLHYEGAIRGGWTQGHHASDVVCPMYPSIDAIVRHATSGRQDRPLIMCEYSHAMGNSNGTLREYWDAIDTHPGLQGGFIWEMWDHGLVQAQPDGSWRYAYGGDFGEDRHDGNFCCDGLFFPDRTAKPAMHEFKQIASPLRITADDGGYIVQNRQWFRDASDYLLHWTATNSDGTSTEGELVLPAVPPRDHARISLPTAALLTVSIRRVHGTAWSPAMAEVGWAQFVGAEPAATTVPAQSFDAEQLDRLAGISLWRAPTDNDRISGLAERWERWGIQQLREDSRQVSTTDATFVVERVLTTSAGITLNHTRTITQSVDGTVVREQLELPSTLDDVARVGTLLQLPPVSAVTWFGAGPYETYPDRCIAQLGTWTASLAELHTDYIRPQENGARTAVRWAELDTADARLRIVNAQPAQMSFSRYSDAQLAAATHNVELVPEPVTHVHIDAVHRGVGTASCGPDTLAQYRIAPGTYTWSWTIGTISG